MGSTVSKKILVLYVHLLYHGAALDLHDSSEALSKAVSYSTRRREKKWNHLSDYHSSFPFEESDMPIN